MFPLVSGRHVGAHVDGHQHGVSIQSVSQSSEPRCGEHKAPTNFFHSDRSWASHRSSFHVFPAVSISSSMVLRQVPSGLPRCLLRLRQRLERTLAFLHAKDMTKPRPPSSFHLQNDVVHPCTPPDLLIAHLFLPRNFQYSP